MVQIQLDRKSVTAKIVYYGPGMSGKTTNLEVVHERAPECSKGNLTSISTDGDRTLFFDFMPLDLGTIAGMHTRFQIYTVPGQVYYNSTRRLVLQGVDGVVFVADSSASMLQENLDSLKNLRENLAEYGQDLDDLPLVIQYNKRDLPDAMDVSELEAALNRRGAPQYEAVANIGTGVFPTLKALAALVLQSVHQQSDQEPAPRAPVAKPASAPSTAPASPPMAAAPPAAPAQPAPAAPSVSAAQHAPAPQPAPVAPKAPVLQPVPAAPTVSAPQPEPVAPSTPTLQSAPAAPPTPAPAPAPVVHSAPVAPPAPKAPPAFVAPPMPSVPAPLAVQQVPASPPTLAPDPTPSASQPPTYPEPPLAPMPEVASALPSPVTDGVAGMAATEGLTSLRLATPMGAAPEEAQPPQPPAPTMEMPPAAAPQRMEPVHSPVEPDAWSQPAAADAPAPVQSPEREEAAQVQARSPQPLPTIDPRGPGRGSAFLTAGYVLVAFMLGTVSGALLIQAL